MTDAVSMDRVARIGWIAVLGLLGFGSLLGWPPQRRVGDWVDSSDRPIPWQDAGRFNRFEFGYLPTFRPVTQPGQTEKPQIAYTLKLDAAGPYTIQNYRWQIDWFWALALGGALSLLLIVIATYREAPESNARAL